jgi:hypothetical protein
VVGAAAVVPSGALGVEDVEFSVPAPGVEDGVAVEVAAGEHPTNAITTESKKILQANITSPSSRW